MATNQFIEQPVSSAQVPSRKSEMDLSGKMVLWTWATFAVAAVILYKIAWKPILAALDKREERIRRALDGAEKAVAETASLRESHGRMVAEAEASARQIVERARRAAEETASTIRAETQRETVTMIQNAEREIKSAQEEAAAALRKESAKLAIAIAEKLMAAKMDDQQNRDLVERVLKEL